MSEVCRHSAAATAALRRRSVLTGNQRVEDVLPVLPPATPRLGEDVDEGL